MKQSKKRSLNKLSLNKEKMITLSQERLVNVVGGDGVESDTNVGIANTRVLCIQSKGPCTAHSSFCSKGKSGPILICL